MTKQLYFNLDPDAVDAYGDISDILKDTIKRFDSLNKTVMKAERQLLKFDEINRLVAYEVKEKTVSSGKSSSGGSSKSSSKSSTTKKDTTGTGTGKSTKQKSYEASLPIKNKVFWIALIPALLLLVQTVCSVFGIELDFGNLRTSCSP